MKSIDLLKPGMPNYESTKQVVDQFQLERKSIENQVIRGMEKELPVNRLFDIRSISLPDEKPATLGVRYEPDRDLLQCTVDFPGQSVTDHNQYLSYRMLGTRDWVIIKDPMIKKSDQPFKRKLFPSAFRALDSIFDEFMAHSRTFIKRKADYQPKLLLE